MIYLHVCCALCYAKALEGLKEEYGDNPPVTAVWFNPNIHPLIEYRRRLKAVQIFSERVDIPLVIIDEYGLNEFCRLTAENQQVPGRCEICYNMRFKKVAEIAADNAADTFSSTLCTSPHQPHELIKKCGESAAAANGIKFAYRNWREFAPDEKLIKGIYRQQYCGCIFSEYDRFKDTNLHLYKA